MLCVRDDIFARCRCARRLMRRGTLLLAAAAVFPRREVKASAKSATALMIF